MYKRQVFRLPFLRPGGNYIRPEGAVQQKMEEIIMARRMTVHRDGNAIYDIVIQSSFDYLGQEVKALSVEGRKLCIVTCLLYTSRCV